MRRAEDLLRGTDLDDLPEIHDRDAVGEVAHDAKVMRDEEIGDTLLRLQIDKEVEDGRLHRDVERRCRLVAKHERRRAGESARDRDALLEPAREEGGPQIEMMRPQLHGGGERGDALIHIRGVSRPSRGAAPRA